MALDYRSKIAELARAEDGIHPGDIAKKLGISRQMVHRYLRELVQKGVLEARGRKPDVRYFAAGLPRLDAARAWFSSKAAPHAAEDFVCAVPGWLAGRIGRLAELVAQGLPKADLPGLTSVVAQLAQNSFDHNDGAWHDVPGCWLEARVAGNRLWICVADRGQGVLRSLRSAHPEIGDEQAALVAAFERTLSGSGRAGEGLKKVRAIVESGERGIACRSGRGLAEDLVDYGRLGPDCRAELARFAASPIGTFTLVAWSFGT